MYDWNAWTPGRAYGPYWQMLDQFMGPGAPPPPGSAPGAPWTGNPISAAGAASGAPPAGAASVAPPGSNPWGVFWAPGNPFTMSTQDPGTGRWSEGWWVDARSQWLYWW